MFFYNKWLFSFKILFFQVETFYYIKIIFNNIKVIEIYCFFLCLVNRRLNYIKKFGKNLLFIKIFHLLFNFLFKNKKFHCLKYLTIILNNNFFLNFLNVYKFYFIHFWYKFWLFLMILNNVFLKKFCFIFKC